jgi:AAHS family 3-hydroxyphenylpropionic acid transporter
MSHNARPAAAGRTVALCFLAAMFEGVDLQCMGLAGPRLGPEFHLGPSQLGLAASASILGLLIGAVFGGRLSDRIGRRWVLIGSMLALGAFSLATTVAADFDALLAIRVLAGLGLGGAMPTLIALSAESAPAEQRGAAVGLMYCGMPLGGVVAALVSASFSGPAQWRLIFDLGGLGPLLLAPLMLIGLKEMHPPAGAVEHRHPRTAAAVLMGEGRALTTALLWLAFFFSLIVLYVLLNWLPALLGAKGFTRPQGAMAGLLLSAGGAAGIVLTGLLMDRGGLKRIIVALYGALILALAGMALFTRLDALLAAAFVAGVAAFGAQSLLYALTPGFYPAAARGTGVGFAVAVGRFGSMLGPLLAGLLLAGGQGTTTILLAITPGLVIALLAALALQMRPSAKALRLA